MYIKLCLGKICCVYANMSLWIDFGLMFFFLGGVGHARCSWLALVILAFIRTKPYISVFERPNVIHTYQICPKTRSQLDAKAGAAGC